MASAEIAAVPTIPIDVSQDTGRAGLHSSVQPQPTTVPASLCGNPRALTKALRVDFSKTSAPSLHGVFLCMLDDVFTADECQTLVSAAEAHTGGLWGQVRETYEEDGIQSVRTCERILLDSHDFMAMLWARIESQVPELKTWAPQAEDVTWQMTRLNERARFLKYLPKQYFQPHIDCYYETPSCEERSFVTLLAFLNDEFSDSSTLGSFTNGSTTFYSADLGKSWTVPAKMGQVILFQQQRLLHSADVVSSGVKFTFRTDVMYKRPS